MRTTAIPAAFRKLTIGQLQKLFGPVGYEVNVSLRKQKRGRKAREASAPDKPKKKQRYWSRKPKTKAEKKAEAQAS